MMSSGDAFRAISLPMTRALSVWMYQNTPIETTQAILALTSEMATVRSTWTDHFEPIARTTTSASNTASGASVGMT